MSVQINVQASQSALAQSIAQGVAAFNSRYAGQNQLNLQINARAFSQPLGRITSDLADFESALKASNARVLAFGASTAVLGGVVRSFKEIANVTIEVEKSLTDINRVLNLSTNNLQKFSSELFSISKQTASSFDDATKAALEFSRQGLNTEETLKRTADALTLVRLTGISSTKAVEDLTATINGFAKAGLTTSQVVNKLAAVEQDFAVSATDLTEALSRTGQAAQEAGVSFDELNALVTTAQQNTARGGAVIGNALKTIFTRLQRTETLDQLENFNIAVRDVQGNILPAVQILKNFADQYNNLADAQRAQLSEQVAGVYQVNILKGVIKDLNNSQGTYVQALERGAMAANEADIANEKLNKTLSALVTQTGVGLQQLANNVGKVTFAPIFEAIVSPVNDAVSYINDTLEGEGIGSIFANGLLKGVRNVIAGPGLAVAFAVIAKVAKNTFEDATKALPAILGLTTEAQKRANIEKSIISILQTQSNLSLALQGQQGNLSSQAATVLNYARLQTAQYQQQLQIAQQLAPLLAAQNVTVGSRGIQVGPKIKAGGHIPAFAEMSERMGAAMGGYKSGKVVKAPTSVGANTYMNSAEEVKYVSGFAQPFINPPANSKAGRKHRQNAINRTGVDPYMASGFIPNFAEKSIKSLGKESLNNLYDVGDRVDNQTYYDKYDDQGLIKMFKLPYTYDEYRLKAAYAFNNALKIYKTQGANGGLENANKYLKNVTGGYAQALEKKYFEEPDTTDAKKHLNKIAGGFAENDTAKIFSKHSKLINQIGPDFSKIIANRVSFVETKVRKNDVSDEVILEKFLRGYAKTSPNSFKRNKEKDVISAKLGTVIHAVAQKSQGFIPNFAPPTSAIRVPWFKKFGNPAFDTIQPTLGISKASDTDTFRSSQFRSKAFEKAATDGDPNLFAPLYEDFIFKALQLVSQPKIKDQLIRGYVNQPGTDQKQSAFDAFLGDVGLEFKGFPKSNLTGSISKNLNDKYERYAKANPTGAAKIKESIIAFNEIGDKNQLPSDFGKNFSQLAGTSYSEMVKNNPDLVKGLSAETNMLLERYVKDPNFLRMNAAGGFIPNFADFIETEIDAILQPISKSRTIQSKQLFGKTLDSDAIRYLNATSVDRLNKFLSASGYLDGALGVDFPDHADKKFLFIKNKGFIPNFAYKQSVMALEESMSGNKAIFDTKPFPHIRNSSQPTFSSAISDHGGLKNALSDSMRNQEAAGLMSNGFVPNFADFDIRGTPLQRSASVGGGAVSYNKINKAVNDYVKSIDLLTTDNTQIAAGITKLLPQFQLNQQSFNEVRRAAIDYAKAQKQAAAQISQQQQPAQKTLSTRVLGASRGGKFDKAFGRLSNNIGFNLAAPLLGGIAESFIAGGKDRSEMGYGQRLASSGASAALSGLSTGAAIGSAIPGIGTAAGAAIGALVGFGGAALNAKTSLEDLQKASENYRNETQTAVESGKGIINIVKSLENLDPNSLEAFDANQKLEEYFIKISETGLDQKFREAGNDVEKMKEAVKAYEMERMASAKRLSESEKRMSKKDLTIEELNKRNILRTEKKAVTKYSRGYGGPSSYTVMEDVLANTGTAGEANFQQIVSQNSQLFADLESVQNQLGKSFGEFATEFRSQFSDLIFNQGELSDILKKYNVTGVNTEQLANQLQEVARDNGEYGKFIVENFDKILQGLADGKYKTVKQAVENQKKLAERQESVRERLFRYSQAIEESISKIGIQIENFQFERDFGKLNLEKSAQIINEGLSAISKNIDSAFKNQFDFLVDQTSNLQQKRLLDFEAQNFQKDLGAQAESRRLSRAKELVSVLQTALGETASDQIDTLVSQFRSTGRVDVGGIDVKSFADGAKSKRAIEAFNLTTRLSDEEAKNKEDNARKIFMLEQAYANQSLKLKNETGKLDYDLSERRYKNAVREKELIDSISDQSKQIQIRGQAQIERSRIEADSPYFMLGQSEFTIADEKRRREAAATKSGFELEARQAIADAEIARIQREVLADNTNATLQNTTAIEALIMSMTAQGNKDFLQQNETLKAIDEQIKIQESFSTAESTYGITSNSELQNLRARREAIVSSSNYAANKASSEIYNRQMENQIARQTLAERKVQGGAFAAIDLSTINDPIKYLDERASKEKVVLKSLESQKNILKIMGEDRALTTEESAKLKALDEQIAQQRKVVNEIDTANLSIKMKITNEDKKQYQYNKDALKRGTFTTGVAKAVGAIRSETEMFKETLGTTTVNAFRDGLVGAMDAALNKADDLESALMGVAAGFLREIQGVMLRNIANQLVGSVMPNFGAPATGNQRGGIIRAQSGMYISGGRTGDKNPALLEDGEYVLNRNAVKALGGPRAIDQLNFNAFPRFADGGDPGTMSASVSMGEPFERLSMYGREQSPEYQAYVERLREAEAAREKKRAERKALLNQFIGTLITTGVMAGLTSAVKSYKDFGMKGKAVKGSAYSKTVAGKLESKASLFGSPEDMTIRQKGGIIGLNQGGFLPYGSRLTDSIPAYLTGGEYVINSRAVRKYGVGGLNRINSGVARFQDGGMVGDGMSPSSNSSNTSNSNISINITVNANNGKVGDQESDSTGDNTESNSKELSNRIKAVVLDVITTEQRSGGLLDSTKKK